jgi:hypothetical protein
MNQPVMRADPLSRKEIQKAAMTILRDFCPAALEQLIPLDIENLFELYLPKRFGIETAYDELSFGIHGFTDPNKMRSVVSIQLVETEDIGTSRFGRSTLGHEVGHAVLHARQFKKKRAETKFFHNFHHSDAVLFRQQDLKPFENPEWQAWEFCKALFLPCHLIEEAVTAGKTVREIAETVNLNPAFVEVRLKNLKLN